MTILPEKANSCGCQSPVGERRQAGSDAQRVITRSPQETHELARSFLDKLGKGSVLALHGDLGSGKTCFVQGLAKAMGICQAVTSPSFTVINEYSGRLKLYHIDLYRLQGIDDIMSIGLDDYLEPDGITAIEWAEHADSFLPENAIHLTFEVLPDQAERAITIVAGRV